MTDTLTHPKRGDQFVWTHGNLAGHPVFIEVQRVAKDATWADIRCFTWACSWSKRQPLPLPAGTKPTKWTLADVEASIPEDAR